MHLIYFLPYLTPAQGLNCNWNKTKDIFSSGLHNTITTLFSLLIVHCFLGLDLLRNPCPDLSPEDSLSCLCQNCVNLPVGESSPNFGYCRTVTLELLLKGILHHTTAETDWIILLLDSPDVFCFTLCNYQLILLLIKIAVSSPSRKHSLKLKGKELT